VGTQTPALMIMVVGVLLAAAADVRTRRIPNALTGTLAALAIAASVAGGLSGIFSTLLVMLAAFGLGTFAFHLGWFGGGDVKLLAACCGFAGFPGSVELLLLTLIAGGMVAIVSAARQRRLRSVLLGAYRITTGIAAEKGQTATVPYAVAIAAGACVYALSTTSSLFHFLKVAL
jgi:prepilin peptidase CpaA